MLFKMNSVVNFYMITFLQKIYKKIYIYLLFKTHFMVIYIFLFYFYFTIIFRPSLVKVFIRLTVTSLKSLYIALESDVRRQYVDFFWRYENIGFQNFVVTYWPSSWLRPCSLCGAVFWRWISNASRTFRWNLLASTFNVFTLFQLNPALQRLAWLDMPVKSHFSSLMDFLCWSILVETLSDVSLAYFLPQLQLAR